MWDLEDFLLRFDEWVEAEDPPEDWRRNTLAWAHSLQTNPYRNATRVLQLGTKFWFAEVTGAGDHERAVVCFYRVDEDEHRIRCSNFTILSRPIVI